jgi:molybdopterin-containing oxidoreductase family membrane subunit
VNENNAVTKGLNGKNINYLLWTLSAGFIAAGVMVLLQGLDRSGMNNIFPWGIWTIAIMVIMALGDGAFLAGFLFYILRVDSLKPVINSAILLSFLSTMAAFILMILNSGQPLRLWFSFAHPNWGSGLFPANMITAVSFCMIIYFILLCLQLVPVTLSLSERRGVRIAVHYMKKLVWILAAAGTFIAFFLQGSLGGGIWEDMWARPAWNRGFHEFFILAVSAAAAGSTAFLALATLAAEKITGKKSVLSDAIGVMAKISGRILAVCLAVRILDILLSAFVFVPETGRRFADTLGGYYGLWMTALELLLLVAAAVFLNLRKIRERRKFMIYGLICAVAALITARTSMVLNGFSIPEFPWRESAAYLPGWQEWLVLAGLISFITLAFAALSKRFRLLP